MNPLLQKRGDERSPLFRMPLLELKVAAIAEHLHLPRPRQVLEQISRLGIGHARIEAALEEQDGAANPGRILYRIEIKPVIAQLGPAPKDQQIGQRKRGKAH